MSDITTCDGRLIERSSLPLPSLFYNRHPYQLVSEPAWRADSDTRIYEGDWETSTSTLPANRLYKSIRRDN